MKISIENYKLLLSFIPDWAKNLEKGLDLTMYGTGSYKGDEEIIQKLDKLYESVGGNEICRGI